MKTKLTFLFGAILGLSLSTVSAQPGMGGPPPCPEFGTAMARLLGEHKTFSANLEFQVKEKSGEMTIMPGKLAYLEGKSHFAVNMAEVKSPQLPAGDRSQLKEMGMDKMTVISRPDKKVSYYVYPSMNAYFESPLKEAAPAQVSSDYKLEVTELGKEVIDGHECVKNKVVGTDKDGKKEEATVWNAGDLKKFPLRIETVEDGKQVVKLFKDVKLTKPDAALFDAPAGSTKYDSMMALIQGEMMKRMGGGGGFPLPGR